MSQPTPSDSFDIQNLQSNLRSGRWSAEAIAEESLRRIETCRDDAIWISRSSEDDVVRAAKAATRKLAEGQRSPLLGIPFAVKDNIDVAGQLTTAACPDFAYRATRTATAVARLIDAGAILMGKTNLDQFATGLVGTRSPYGTPRNRFDSRYISGGSSSGSAVAVAAGLVSFSLGTDTAGSGRVPAAFNNIVGLKPTRGLISTMGVVPACRSLDCVSLFALNCCDAATVLGVAAGYDPLDDFSREPWQIPPRLSRLPSRFRFGIPASAYLNFFGDTDGQFLFEKAVAILKEVGGTAVEIDFEPFTKAGALLYQGPWLAERLMTMKPLLQSRPAALLPVIRQIIEAAEEIAGEDVFRGFYQLKALRRRAEDQWAKMDVLIVPTVPRTYAIKSIEQEPIRLNLNLGYYTNFANLMDLSAVAIPIGFNAVGLPGGASLIAPAGFDAAILALGEVLHRRAGVNMGATNAPVPPANAMPALGEAPVRLAVVGAHLSGQPLNFQLTDLNAQLVRSCRTASRYGLYALAGTQPPKPGLVRRNADDGARIEVEVWDMTVRAFGQFVAAVPAPMTIGTVELEDGTTVKGFLCEPIAILGAQDITHVGSWRAYLNNLSR